MTDDPAAAGTNSRLGPSFGLTNLSFVPVAAGSFRRAESEAIERRICFYTEKFETSPARFLYIQ